MKTLWNVFAIFLLLNVLALAGFIAWLGSSGRLNGERMRGIAKQLSITVQEERKITEEAAAAEEEARKKAEAAARLESVSKGPVTMGDHLAAQQEKNELAMMRVERMRRDIHDLQKQLETAKGQMTQQRAHLDAQRAAFEKAVKEKAKVQDDENFQQTVGMYEQLKAKQVKQMFQELINKGQADQVVDYLAAMQQRKAAAVLKEFKSPQDVVQAADLLERLRQRGVDPQEAASDKQPGRGAA